MIKTQIPVYLYAIECKALSAVKLGTSTNVMERLAGLQTANAAELTLLWFVPGSVKLEFAVHELLCRAKLRGEWFDITQSEVQAFLQNPMEFAPIGLVEPVVSTSEERQLPYHKPLGSSYQVVTNPQSKPSYPYEFGKSDAATIRKRYGY